LEVFLSLSICESPMPSNLQGLSFLVAMILKAIGPHPSYDSDDDYASDRAPLLKDVVHPPPYVVGNPVMGSRNNAWSIRITEKVGRDNLLFQHSYSHYCQPPLCTILPIHSPFVPPT